MIFEDGHRKGTPPLQGLESPVYIKVVNAFHQQTAPFRWVNMNALTVLSVVALAACSSAQLLNYPGIIGYPGYSRFLPAAAHTPYALNVLGSAPLAYNVAPLAPVAPVQSQYHAQDELGQYSFGFSGGPSSRAETRDAFGVVRGSYNYIDTDGKIQTQHYIADAAGFRVSGTNLPVAPDAPAAAPLALPGPLPEPVEDTPEVAAAKAAHFAAYDEAAAAAAVAPARKRRSVVVSPGFPAYSPLRFSYGFSTPLNYGHPAVVGSPLHYTATAAAPAFTTYAAAAPAFNTYAAVAPAVTAYTAAAAAPRDAELLRVVHNPGHAVSYRVD